MARYPVYCIETRGSTEIARSCDCSHFHCVSFCFAKSKRSQPDPTAKTPFELSESNIFWTLLALEFEIIWIHPNYKKSIFVLITDNAFAGFLLYTTNKEVLVKNNKGVILFTASTGPQFWRLLAAHCSCRSNTSTGTVFVFIPFTSALYATKPTLLPFHTTRLRFLLYHKSCMYTFHHQAQLYTLFWLWIRA